MKKTRLYDHHIALGGRMVDFAGWELPVQYPTGPTGEHVAVRTAAGLFDIDHMGQFELTGIDAVPFLNSIQVADVGRLEPLDARYSLLPYADGTIVDAHYHVLDSAELPAAVVEQAREVLARPDYQQGALF